MRRVLRALFLTIPVAIIAVFAVVPMPLQWSVGGMLLGLLFFQMALVGIFDVWLPETRYYLELRAETDRLLQLVRELNAVVIDAKRVGANPAEETDPIVERLHHTVDRLPVFAGQSVDGRLHLTPLVAKRSAIPRRIH